MASHAGFVVPTTHEVAKFLPKKGNSRECKKLLTMLAGATTPANPHLHAMTGKSAVGHIQSCITRAATFTALAGCLLYGINTQPLYTMAARPGHRKEKTLGKKDAETLLFARRAVCAVFEALHKAMHTENAAEVTWVTLVGHMHAYFPDHVMLWVSAMPAFAARVDWQSMCRSTVWSSPPPSPSPPSPPPPSPSLLLSSPPPRTPSSRTPSPSLLLSSPPSRTPPSRTPPRPPTPDAFPHPFDSPLRRHLLPSEIQGDFDNLPALSLGGSALTEIQTDFDNISVLSLDGYFAEE